jgi:hypothetical protein
VDAEVAYSYAKSVYTSEISNARCRSYTTPIIKSTTQSAECLISDDICFDEKASEASTDSIDSSTDLGINARREHQIIYDRRLVCASLVVEGYKVPYLNGYTRDLCWRYFYGRLFYDTYIMLHNATMLYSVECSKANDFYYTKARDNIR